MVREVPENKRERWGNGQATFGRRPTTGSGVPIPALPGSQAAFTQKRFSIPGHSRFAEASLMADPAQPATTQSPLRAGRRGRNAPGPKRFFIGKSVEHGWEALPRRMQRTDEGRDSKSGTYILEPLVKSPLGSGSLIETGTNITIVVGKRHLCPRSECELIDFAKASLIYSRGSCKTEGKFRVNASARLVELHNFPSIV